jgi:dTDP-4-dehydrorhamnose reductase
VRVALIGAGGQLGTDIAAAVRKAGMDLLPLWSADCDVTDRTSLERAFAGLEPGDIVVNTAAFHRTDDCEDRPDLAFAVNSAGAHNVATAARARGAAVAFFSSDFVFDGAQAARPYVESDAVKPINIYGVSKAAGETLVGLANPQAYVVRVASVFGVAGSRGKGGNFVETMLAKAKQGERIEVVDDIVMSPTFAADAAELTVRLIADGAPYGVYHLTNSGACSWHEFADAILTAAGSGARAAAVASARVPTRAARPAYSALASQRLSALGLTVRPWRDGLFDYLRARGHVA